MLAYRCLQCLSRSTDSKLHEMVHKRLQADIICEDGLSCLTDTSVRGRSMRSRGIQLSEQETSLRATSIADDESWKRETVLNEVL